MAGEGEAGERGSRRNREKERLVGRGREER